MATAYITTTQKSKACRPGRLFQDRYVVESQRTPHGQDADYFQTGEIQRMTIPKSQGKIPYRDARKAMWGDLYPHPPKTKIVTRISKAEPSEEKEESIKAQSSLFVVNQIGSGMRKFKSIQYSSQKKENHSNSRALCNVSSFMKNQKTKENGRSIYSWFQGSSSRKQSTPINLEEEEEDEDLKLAIELSLEQQVKEQKAIFEQLERQCAALRDQKRHRHRTSSIHSDNGSDENNDSFETISFRKVKEEKVRESSPGLSDVSSVDIEDISEYLAQCGAPIKPEPGPSTAAPSLSPLLSPTSPPARSPSLSPPPPPPSPPRSSSTCSRQKGKQRASFVRKAHRIETQATEDQDTHFQQQHINLDEFVESLTIPTRKVYARKTPLKGKEMGSLVKAFFMSNSYIDGLHLPLRAATYIQPIQTSAKILINTAI